MTDNDKIHARLMKLYELAKRGEHGERENAQRFLEKQLAKHGMTIADLDDAASATQRFKFTYKTDVEHRLLNQILFSVLQTGNLTVWHTRGKRGFDVEMTKAQHLEVEMRYAVYRRELAQQMDHLFVAFIHKNDITGPAREDDDAKPAKQRSEAELAAIRRMMRGIERTELHKAIEG
jgi:hypothetical protein